MAQRVSQLLFRQQAIDAGRHRLEGAVIASTPPSARVYVLLIGAVLTAAGLVLAFGRYGGGVAVRGVVDYQAGTARVYAPAAGELRSVLVRVGQPITAGAPLAVIALAQGPRGLGVQIDEITHQVAELDRQLGLAAAATMSDRAGLQQQASALAETVASLERQQAIAAGQITIAEGLVGRSSRLAKDGAGTQRQAEEARGAWLSQRAANEALTEKIITTRAALADARHRAMRIGIDAQNVRSELLGKRATLSAQADVLARSDRMLVTSPVAGVVADLAAQPGQRVSAQASIATVVPREAQLEVQLYAPSRAIGFAKVGEPVRLRFDAYPYQKYGAARGKVVAISPVAVDAAAVTPAIDVREPVFRIRVKLGEPSAPRVLRAGMTLSADLLMAPRPLWAMLLSPMRGGTRP